MSGSIWPEETTYEPVPEIEPREEYKQAIEDLKTNIQKFKARLPQINTNTAADYIRECSTLVTSAKDQFSQAMNPREEDLIAPCQMLLTNLMPSMAKRLCEVLDPVPLALYHIAHPDLRSALQQAERPRAENQLLALLESSLKTGSVEPLRQEMEGYFSKIGSSIEIKVVERIHSARLSEERKLAWTEHLLASSSTYVSSIGSELLKSLSFRTIPDVGVLLKHPNPAVRKALLDLCSSQSPILTVAAELVHDQDIAVRQGTVQILGEIASHLAQIAATALGDSDLQTRKSALQFLGVSLLQHGMGSSGFSSLSDQLCLIAEHDIKLEARVRAIECLAWVQDPKALQCLRRLSSWFSSRQAEVRRAAKRALMIQRLGKGA